MQSGDAPSWLSASNNPDHAPNNPAPLELDTKGSSSGNNGAASSSSDDDEDLPKVILTMRLANMAVASALIGVSVSLTCTLEYGMVLCVHTLFW